jgi:tetratricopeptide (TPR) repeat protein
MTVQSDNLGRRNSSSTHPTSVRSTEKVIDSIVQLESDEDANVVGDRGHQLRGLIQTLKNREGRFALIFAICHNISLKKKLTKEIKARLSPQHICEVQLKSGDRLLDRLLNVPGAPDPLFAYGIEQLIPPIERNQSIRAKTNRLLREESIQELQLRREYFRQLNRPLVLWMPEYAYEIIGQQAHDFWSWGRHSAFFFTERQSKKTGLADPSIGTDTVRAGGDVVTKGGSPGDAKITHTALSFNAATRLHEVPRPPADFTGREDELRELLALIEVAGVTISGLQGMGGIGKTALALKLVELLKPRYPDAQFFLDLKGASTQPLTVAEALAHVIRAYHPAAKLPDSESELRGLYLSVLDGQRALLLMDNAANAAQVEPLIPPAGCVLLVTSRQHFTLPGLAAKNLDTLSAADARDLLLTIAPRIGTHADEIAALCGHLPLALRLAAAAMVNYRILSPADYVRRLRDRQQRLQLIDASLSLSYELLSEALRKCWRRLAVFPETFASSAAAAVWEVEVDQAKDRLGELIAASLVEWNETSDRYRLHEIGRLFADSKLSVTERIGAEQLHAIHYKQVLSEVDNFYLAGDDAIREGLALFDLEWGNIVAGQAWAAAQAQTNKDAAALSIAYTEAGAYVLNLRQHPRDRIHWLETSVSAAQRLREKHSEGNALANLGLAYAALGKVRRAIHFYEQALFINREIGNLQSEGNTLGNLGLSYAALGETTRAIQFYEQALAIDREIGDRRGEAASLGNLGLAYADLGETTRAIAFHQQYLNIAREIGDRRGQNKALENLGVAYADLGETHTAIEYYDMALQIARELGDRRGEANALVNIGFALADLGETQQAIDHYRRSLAIHREVGDRRGESYDLWGLSLASERLGDRAQAIALSQQSLEIREQIEDRNIEKVRKQLAEWRHEDPSNGTVGIN